MQIATGATIEIRNVIGTEAALGWASGYALVIDRPSVRTRSLCLGFNGAHLLGFTIAGSFANDLRHIADAKDININDFSITVRVTLQGDPIIATNTVMRASVNMAGGTGGSDLIKRTSAISMAMNSLNRGEAVRLVV